MKDIKYAVKTVQNGMSLLQEFVIFFIRTFIKEYNLLIKIGWWFFPRIREEIERQNCVKFE